MSAIAEYKLLSTDEKNFSLAENDRKLYPGSRRVELEGNPPQNTLLIKTAGNALQAVPREQLERKGLIRVTVPENTDPGDEIIVVCDNRHIRATIPESAAAGSVFFIQAPTIEPIIVTGVPVDAPLVGEAPVIINSQDVSTGSENELELSEETPQRQRTAQGSSSSQHKETSIESEFELV